MFLLFYFKATNRAWRGALPLVARLRRSFCSMERNRNISRRSATRGSTSESQEALLGVCTAGEAISPKKLITLGK